MSFDPSLSCHHLSQPLHLSSLSLRAPPPPPPQPPLRRGCHIAARGAPRAADSTFPRPQLGTQSREAVPAGPRGLWPTRNFTLPIAPRPARTTSEGTPPGRRVGRSGPRPTLRVPSATPPPDRAPLCPSPRAPRSLTQRRADHESQQRPHDCARPSPRPPVLIAGREALGPAAVRMSPGARGRSSCGSGTSEVGEGGGARPPRSGYRRGPSPGARRPGIPAVRVAAVGQAAALARAAGRIRPMPGPRPL